MVSKFEYFRDPDNFAFKIDTVLPCSICKATGLWFDAGGFYGVNAIKCICDNCLADGKLESLGIETNEVQASNCGDSTTIIYRTPALPTWQDRIWPCVDSEYCVFERMAAKDDFVSMEEFRNAFSKDVAANSDLNWLWEQLPEKRIRNYLEGNFNVSVYLFTCGDKKHCTWDAS